MQLRKDNKEILKALPTSNRIKFTRLGKNCYTSLSGYSKDVIGICSAIILAPIDSDINDLLYKNDKYLFTIQFEKN